MLPARLWSDRVDEIFRDWDQSDSASAEGWLRTLPSEARIKAIVDYSNAAAAEQAARVFQLVTLIDDPSSRRDALQKFVNNLSDDPAEAREKIAALSLTDQQKQMLLRLLGKKQ